MVVSPYLKYSDQHPYSSYCLFSITCSIYHLQGLALGGVWGVREGARRPLAVSNARLRINSILNSVTRRGTFIGNSAGVLGRCQYFSDSNFAKIISVALVYNGINSTIDSFRGKHDIAGSMTAGGLTGALYKSTGADCVYADVYPCINIFCFLSAGVRPAIAAATFVSGLAGIWSYVKKSV
jgi:mitochondrial import inner membrane translocase subunit TIM23